MTNSEESPQDSPENSSDSDQLSPGMKFYQDLIQDAWLTPGDAEAPEDDLDIRNADWFKPELIQEGKDFFRRNVFSVMLAHMVAVGWTFTFRPMLPILLSTGKSDGMQESLVRYLSTVLHIKLWYEGDIIDKVAAGTKDILTVRKMHALARKNFLNRVNVQGFKTPDANLTPRMKKLYKALQSDMACIDDSKCPTLLYGVEECPLSQFGMVATQFAFIGFIIRNSQLYGMKSRKGLDAFVHKWAILGKVLGIQDRFNLGIHCLRRPGSFDDNTKEMEAVDLIFDRLYLPAFKHMPEISLHMIECLTYGLSQYTVTYTPGGFLYLIVREVIGIRDPSALWSVMNLEDKMCSFRLLTASSIMRKSDPMRKLANAAIRKMISNGGKKFTPARRNHSKKAKETDKVKSPVPVYRKLPFDAYM